MCPLFADAFEKPIRFCACTGRESDTKITDTSIARQALAARAKSLWNASRLAALQLNVLWRIEQSNSFSIWVYLEFYTFIRRVRNSRGAPPGRLPLHPPRKVSAMPESCAPESPPQCSGKRCATQVRAEEPSPMLVGEPPRDSSWKLTRITGRGGPPGGHPSILPY